MTATKNPSPSIPDPSPDLILSVFTFWRPLQRLSSCLYNTAQFGYLTLVSILRRLVKLYQNSQIYSFVLISSRMVT